MLLLGDNGRQVFLSREEPKKNIINSGKGLAFNKTEDSVFLPSPITSIQSLIYSIFYLNWKQSSGFFIHSHYNWDQSLSVHYPEILPYHFKHSVPLGDRTVISTLYYPLHRYTVTMGDEASSLKHEKNWLPYISPNYNSCDQFLGCCCVQLLPWPNPHSPLAPELWVQQTSCCLILSGTFIFNVEIHCGVNILDTKLISNAWSHIYSFNLASDFEWEGDTDCAFMHVPVWAWIERNQSTHLPCF